ncbi:MAG: hypothetical protein KTR29_03165 [Rhodothermaceae bacterium]|nr:hypothetical protein [Rhodothermaceae bacterium]
MSDNSNWINPSIEVHHEQDHKEIDQISFDLSEEHGGIVEGELKPHGKDT